MLDKNNLLDVLQRIKIALGVTQDAELAQALGLTAVTFNKRKIRGNFPRTEIDALIASEDINPEFVYSGIGRTHIDMDSEAWALSFARRLRPYLQIETYVKALVTNGHKLSDFKKIEAGTVFPTIELLRDMRRFLGTDLNHLFLGDVDVALDKSEQALIAAYRAADKSGKAFIEQACKMSTNAVPTPRVIVQNMSSTGVQVGGSVSNSQIHINTTPVAKKARSRR